MKIILENEKSKIGKIIAVDFDGTIVDHNFPEIGNLKDFSKQTINKWYDNGYEIIIWTCRANEYLDSCKQFLDKNGIKYTKINENSDSVDFDTGKKIYYDILIDDRAMGFIESWLYIDSCLNNFFKKQ